MKRKSQILLVTLVALVVLALSAVIGISLISSKEISIGSFISRAGGWFSSTISSLEYGLYKLKFQNIPPESEISIPYFSEENLIPFFKAPFTITIYGEQFIPIIYEGYFGFRDLFYPVAWLFKWLVTKEKGEIKNITINPVEIGEGYYSSLQPSGYYAYYQNPDTQQITCAPILTVYNFIRFLNPVYAALQIADCEVSSVLMDQNLNSYILLGDNPSTTPTCENFILDIDLGGIKYVDHLEIYVKYAYPGSDIVIIYWDVNLNDWKAWGVLQDLGEGWRYPGLGVYTNKIRLFTNYACQVNLHVQLSEVNVVGN